MPFADLTQETQDFLRQKAITIKPLGRQTSDRFQSNFVEYNEERIPTIRDWRLNLTRLSHVYNLYLVAYKDQIHVYEPRYPDQQLPSQPSLIIELPMTGASTSGYIDPACPHSINHLLVDFLGDLEVVIIACDDGDAFGFYMHDIQTAIENRSSGSGPSSIIEDNLRPFFGINCERSAWGLSIHRQARKIAVSSNARKAWIMLFGLSEMPSSWTKPIIARPNCNVACSIKGHYDNLPSLTFCNTEDDPQGKILICGDIKGHIYTHDPFTPDEPSIMRVGFCRQHNRVCGCSDATQYPHGIWGLTFLDRRAFRRIDGYAPGRDLDESYMEHWDGSIMKLCIPDSRGIFRLKRARQSLQDTDVEGDEDSQEEEEQEDDLDWNDNSDDDNVSDADLAEVLNPSAHPHLPHSHDNIIWTATQKAADAVPLDEHLPRSLRSLSHPWYANVQPVGSISIMAQLKTRPKKFSFRQIGSAKPTFDGDFKYEPHRFKFRSPMLITSKTDMVLTQPEASDWDDSVAPFIAFEEPLKQQYYLGQDPTVPPFTAKHADRMSFHTVIAELGIVIIGSPSGRVGVFSLLRTDGWPSRQDGVYFMRFDWTLPLASEEDAGLRPEKKLVGLTAGPIQGQLGLPKDEVRRRWRLMLYYIDHSVLSYELGLPE